MPFHTDFRRIVLTLSDALDLVGVDDVGHGKRVGIMAAECAAVMGLEEDERSFLFDLGLLHDIGVSSTRVHQHLVTEFDWPEAWRHCRTGHDLLADFGPLSVMAEPILHHHTPWNRLRDEDVPSELALRANLILLTDRVDAMAASFHADKTVLAHAERIRDQIQSHSETYFAPELVAHFLEASRTEAFWLRLESPPRRRTCRPNSRNPSANSWISVTCASSRSSSRASSMPKAPSRPNIRWA